MYEAYNNWIEKHKLKPKEIIDEIKRFTIDNHQGLDAITCEDINETNLKFTKQLNILNLVLYSLDISNYTSFLNFLLERVQAIAQLIGNNCSNAVDYVSYFKDQADDLEYLHQKSTQKNPKLYIKLYFHP
jgi:hypothetical protein